MKFLWQCFFFYSRKTAQERETILTNLFPRAFWLCSWFPLGSATGGGVAWAGPPTQRRGRRYSVKKTDMYLIYKNDVSSQSHAELQTLIVKSALPWPSHDTCVPTLGKHRGCACRFVQATASHSKASAPPSLSILQSSTPISKGGCGQMHVNPFLPKWHKGKREPFSDVLCVAMIQECLMVN